MQQLQLANKQAFKLICNQKKCLLRHKHTQKKHKVNPSFDKVSKFNAIYSKTFRFSQMYEKMKKIMIKKSQKVSPVK